MQEILQVIQQCEVFRGLSGDQQTRLAQISQRLAFSSGEVIVEQNTFGDTMYVVAQGQVEILKLNADSILRTTLFLGEGQVFGELALLDQGVRTATVVADDNPTIVYALQRDAFNDLCRADTALGYRIMRNLALDLAFKLRYQDLDSSARGMP